MKKDINCKLNNIIKKQISLILNLFYETTNLQKIKFIC